MVSNPDTEGVRRGLLRPDLFTVVVDLFHTETTDYADIVLPSTMQHEQFEINDSFAHAYLHLNRPAVEPPGRCLPHTEIFRRLARAMGLDDPVLQATDAELGQALLDTPAFAEAGITIETLSERGWVRLPGTEHAFLPFADGFPTESGRFEFASDKAEREGHGRVPSFHWPTESGTSTVPDAVGADDESFPRGYDLIAAASDHHVNSVFAGTDLIRSRTGRPVLVIHPGDAAPRRSAIGGRGRGGQRARAVPGHRRGLRYGAARCRRHHQGMVGGWASTPPWPSAMPTWVGVRCTTTTGCRSGLSPQSAERGPTRRFAGPAGRSSQKPTRDRHRLVGKHDRAVVPPALHWRRLR